MLVGIGLSLCLCLFYCLILFCAVVFVVVVLVTSAICRQFLIARVDVFVAPLLCAVEIRRLTGAIRLSYQMVGTSKCSSVRQVASANILINLFSFFRFIMTLGADSRFTSRLVCPGSLFARLRKSTINPLTPNDPQGCRTVPLTSKFVFYIFNKYRY